jgi:hypothetical protein
MKNFTTKTITTLALILLTQTLSASYSINDAERLDIANFSSVWQELNKNNKTDQEHLISYMNNLLDNSVKIAYEECTPSIDVAKFSSLWQEVNTNNNDAIHLTQALDTTVSDIVCVIS